MEHYQRVPRSVNEHAKLQLLYEKFTSTKATQLQIIMVSRHLILMKFLAKLHFEATSVYNWRCLDGSDHSPFGRDES